MAEINNSLALQAAGSPLNLQSTLSSIAQIDLAKAHAGLYGLQQQQEARKLQGLEYLKVNPTDYMGAIQRGLDPSVGSTLQTIGERDRQYQTNPQRLSTESTQQLTAAGKNIAETGKAQAETRGIGIEQYAKLAQGVIADPSNDGIWRAAVSRHYETNGGSALEKEQLLGIKDPAQRMRIAKAYAAQGVAPSTFGAPHTKNPTDMTITPSDSYAVPQPGGRGPLPPPGQQGGMIGAPGERIIGGAVVQDNGVNIPTDRVTGGHNAVPLPQVPVGGLGVRQPTMTPGQFEQQKGLASKGVDDFAKSQEHYESAQNLKQRLSIIDHNIEQLGPQFMGTFANAKGEMLKGFNSLVSSFPNGERLSIKPDKVATWEDFNKETVRAGMELIKSNFGGSREAASIIQMGNTAVPSAANTYQGAKYVSATINAAAQRQIDLHEYKARLAQEGRPLTGADVAFNKAYPAETYAKTAIASVIPAEAIDMLAKNPNLASQFDAKFGKGMAPYALSRAAQRGAAQ